MDRETLLGLESGAIKSGRERRRHKRYRVGVLTEIETTNQKKIPAITFNMSESGAYLMTLAPLENGEEVALDFVSFGERETLKGRVVHGAELDKNVFWSQGVGIEFVDGVPRFFAVEFEKLIKIDGVEEED